MYLDLWLAPGFKQGEMRLEVSILTNDENNDTLKAKVFDGIIFSNDHAEGQKLETWTVSTMRNILSAVESLMFERLTSGEAPLTLEPRERKIP